MPVKSISCRMSDSEVMIARVEVCVGMVVPMGMNSYGIPLILELDVNKDGNWNTTI